MNCPECGSQKVLVILYGYYPEDPGLGPGVRFGGCMPFRRNRHCEACDAEWWSESDEEPADL